MVAGQTPPFPDELTRKRPLRYPEETDAVNQRVVSRAAEDAIFASLPASSSSSLVFNGSSHPSVLYYCLLHVLRGASPGRISKKSHSGEKSCAKKRSSAKKSNLLRFCVFLLCNGFAYIGE